MIRSPIATRSGAQLVQLEEASVMTTERTPEATSPRTVSQEMTPAVLTLRAVLREVQQLREEQRRAQAEFAEASRQRSAEVQRWREEQQRALADCVESLRQCEAEIQRLREDVHGGNAQLSPSNNESFVANACNRGVVCFPSRGGGRGGVQERAESCAPSRVTARFSAGDGNDLNTRERVLRGNEGDMRERLETRVKLKPDTFDGSVPLREFIAQFDLIARANRWDVETKAVVLASCLRGKARAVLESVQNLENLDFVELKSKLELRFGEAQSLQNYYSQFTNRKQKFGESIASFGSDIERLSQLAYPECSDEVRDKIACAQFVFALSDGFVRRALQLEGATSLRIAIERAKAIRLIQENNFQYKKGNNFRFENRKKQNFYKSDETERIQNDKVKEGAFNKEKFTKFGKKNFKKGTGNGKECWECGKEGHFRSECPGVSVNLD